MNMKKKPLKYVFKRFYDHKYFLKPYTPYMAYEKKACFDFLKIKHRLKKLKI